VDPLDNLPELQVSVERSGDGSSTARDGGGDEMPDALRRICRQTRALWAETREAAVNSGRRNVIKAVRDMSGMIKRTNRALRAGEWRAAYRGCQAIQQRCRRILNAIAE
jgi:hypothetical protein